MYPDPRHVNDVRYTKFSDEVLCMYESLKGYYSYPDVDEFVRGTPLESLPEVLLSPVVFTFVAKSRTGAELRKRVAVDREPGWVRSLYKRLPLVLRPAKGDYLPFYRGRPISELDIMELPRRPDGVVTLMPVTPAPGAEPVSSRREGASPRHGEGHRGAAPTKVMIAPTDAARSPARPAPPSPTPPLISLPDLVELPELVELPSPRGTLRAERPMPPLVPARGALDPTSDSEDEDGGEGDSFLDSGSESEEDSQTGSGPESDQEEEDERGRTTDRKPLPATPAKTVGAGLSSPPAASNGAATPADKAGTFKNAYRIITAHQNLSPEKKYALVIPGDDVLSEEQASVISRSKVASELFCVKSVAVPTVEGGVTVLTFPNGAKVTISGNGFKGVNGVTIRSLLPVESRPNWRVFLTSSVMPTIAVPKKA